MNSVVVNHLFRASLVAVAGYAALLAIEIALTKTHRLIDDGFPKGLFVSGLDSDYTLAPNSRFIVQRIKRFEIKSNSYGYRDADWPDGRSEDRPLLMVGSSALFGFGVESGERFSARVQHYLGGVRLVLNAGVYGYGAPQALQVVEKQCARQRAADVLYFHEYKMTRWDFLLPDARTVVDGKLLTRYRDFGKIQMDEAELKQVAKAEYRGPPVPLYSAATLKLPSTRRWLWRQGWHPMQLIEQMRGIDTLPDAYVGKYMATAFSDEYPENGPFVAAKYISAMKAAADRCNANFAVVMLPGPLEHRIRQDEPATKALLSILGDKVRVIDLRKLDADRPTLVIDGTDYFDASAIDRFSQRLANALTKNDQ